MKRPAEMARLFAAHPEAIERTIEVADRCRFSLSELRYQYPDETERPGETPQQALARLVTESLPTRYPNVVPEPVRAQLAHELRLIATLNYAPYFLTVHAIVRASRSLGILCQGRGSAANSVVCYVLGITAIDPVGGGLLFERFISAERHEPPDIDVDFESDRREEMIQWIYARYGRARAALCATVMRYHGRGAIRDVGKVMGLTEDVTGALARQIWGHGGSEGVSDEHAEALNLNPHDRRLRLALQLARELIGFPRQLGTHPGGFVLTADLLCELVPIAPAAMADRHVIEWDKDDIEALGFMKVDVLGLGMLGCMRRAFEMLDRHRAEHLDLATIPAEDPTTFAMIRKADTLGTFQIESRAQMSMLPRLKPARFYDLVVQVAIVRPGPIQGDMVHPYLRRREGREPVVYPTPELERVLGKTLGVPLFQEQAMQVAIQCAGFTAGEADQLRRSMATFKVTGGVSHFRDKLISGMVARGYEQDFAERTFSQLEGFGSYGFPESHAASFALIAYASAWMKCHHPGRLLRRPAERPADGLLRAGTGGRRRPRARRGNPSHLRQRLRLGLHVGTQAGGTPSRGSPRRGRYLAVRLGLRMTRGLAAADAQRLVEHRGNTPYGGIDQLWRRARLPAASLQRLAEADAFLALGLDRRQALWQVRGLAEAPLPLFATLPEAEETPVLLEAMADGAEVVEDYRAVGLSLRRHPVAFLRPGLRTRGMIQCRDLPHRRDGQRVTVAGLVLVRQRPGSAKGVMFITIEDETGVANLVLWPDRFERQRRLVLTAAMIACTGRVQREGEVIHVVVDRLEDLSSDLRGVGECAAPFPLTPGRGDEATHPAGRDPRGIKVPTRDFR